MSDDFALLALGVIQSLQSLQWRRNYRWNMGLPIAGFAAGFEAAL
jgi:hypothetical protein